MSYGRYSYGSRPYGAGSAYVAAGGGGSPAFANPFSLLGVGRAAVFLLVLVLC